MNSVIILKMMLQCLCDHLPVSNYEQYFHDQASEFSIESRIIYSNAPDAGSIAQKVIVELLLAEGHLTLQGYGADGYTALKDALNVFDAGKSVLKIPMVIDKIRSTTLP